MNGSINRIIYFIVTILIVFFIGTLFIKMLPFLLLLGGAAYIVIKVSGFIKSRKQQKNEEQSNFTNYEERSYNDPADDYTNGEIIDVEYEDIEEDRK